MAPVECADEGRLLDSCQKPFNSAWKPTSFLFLLSGLVQLVAESRSLELTAARRHRLLATVRQLPTFLSLLHKIHKVTPLKLFHIKVASGSFISACCCYLNIFQMIQAIQVLRFHLLELEKVKLSSCPVQRATSDLHGRICRNTF